MQRRCAGTAVTLLLTTLAVSAHHSPAAFDLTSQVTIQGRVSRFDWANPHVYIYVDTASGPGSSTEWMIETDGTSILTRSGWKRDSVAVGSQVTVRANPDRNAQRRHALLVSMATGSGLVLTPRANGGAATSTAASVAGVWNSLRGFTQRRIGAITPTAKGLAAAKAYSEARNPVAGCVPYPAPLLTGLPYLNEIDVRSDRVVIRSEFLNVDRTVFTDGRGHPTDGARTTQGHSIGRWEGTTLVVDTALFSDHLLGSYLGSGSGPRELPSGPRKHVVERFRLAEDRRRLIIDAVIEDPDYLAEPLTVTMEWDYAPQLRLLRFGCEPAQAQRYLLR